MQRRLLVGVDFSEGATAAITEARRLGQMLDAELDLLYVVEPNGPGDAWHDSPSVIAWLGRHAVSPRDVTVRLGIPWLELARRARDTGATLAVVGSHGWSGYHPLAPGTTALRLAVTAPCPVVVAAVRGQS